MDVAAMAADGKSLSDIEKALWKLVRSQVDICQTCIEHKRKLEENI